MAQVRDFYGSYSFRKQDGYLVLDLRLNAEIFKIAMIVSFWHRYYHQFQERLPSGQVSCAFSAHLGSELLEPASSVHVDEASPEPASIASNLREG